MRIAVFGFSELSERLREAGHEVFQASEPREIGSAQLVVLGVAPEQMEFFVEKLAVFAKRGQLFLHSCPQYTLEVFRPLVELGALCFVSIETTHEAWSVTASDEITATVGELLLAECQLRSISVPESKLQEFVAGVAFASFRNQVEIIAYQLLDQAVTDTETQVEIVDNAAGSRALMDVGTLERCVEVIPELADRETFRHLAKRMAQAYRAHDVEWWAMNEGMDKE